MIQKLILKQKSKHTLIKLGLKKYVQGGLFSENVMVLVVSLNYS